jgi:hypothetical protein
MRGLTLLELVVTLAILLAAAAVGAGALAAAIDAVAWQPSAGEIAARAHAVAALVAADLAAAGAGPIVELAPEDPAFAPGVDSHRLAAWLPPVLPRVVGLDGADADTVASTDRFSVLAVAGASPQAVAAQTGADYELRAGPACPVPAGGCGFRPETPVLLLGRAPGFQLAAVRDVAGPTLGLDGLAAWPPEALVARAEVVSYRFDRVRGELLRSRAGGRGQPLLDHLAGFEVEWWGRRLPPRGPRWSGEATCALEADGTPRLPALAGAGDLGQLDPAILGDGPWCGVAPFRFDADLLRVRRIGLRFRLTAEADAARGRDPTRFAVPGRARHPGHEVPDLDLRVDVAPPALRGLP